MNTFIIKLIKTFMHYFFSVPLASDSNIAEIVELENSIKAECTFKKLHQIMELYKRVIENYSSIEDPRALEYQNRMKTLLSSSAVRNVLTGSNPLMNNRRSGEIIRELSTERVVNRCISLHSSENALASETAQNDLKAQSDYLNSRIIKRRRFSQGFGLFEREVEKVIEKYAEEKEKLVRTGQYSKSLLQELEINKKIEISRIRKQLLNL